MHSYYLTNQPPARTQRKHLYNIIVVVPVTIIVNNIVIVSVTLHLLFGRTKRRHLHTRNPEMYSSYLHVTKVHRHVVEF